MRNCIIICCFRNCTSIKVKCNCESRGTLFCEKNFLQFKWGLISGGIFLEKILFWDFDGTLIYSNQSFLDSLQICLESHNYKISSEKISTFLHTACSWHKPEISYTNNTGSKWWDNLFRYFDSFYENYGISQNDRDSINKIFKSRILDHEIYTLYADARMVLEHCKIIGYKNYILSYNFPELPLVVEKLGISEYFTDYIISSNVGYEKPRAELFYHALGVANFPKECYMIGDNQIADIQGAKAVGMKTILVHKNNVSDADFICENLSEIPALLFL